MSLTEEGVRESQWLAHLRLLAGLPHTAPALAPALLATVREGFRADFGALVWGGGGEGANAGNAALYCERMTEPVLRWIATHFESMNDVLPFELEKVTDGDVYRQFMRDRGYEGSPWHTGVYEPLDVRWGMGVPLLNPVGEPIGFMYLHRNRHAGPFSEEEQNRLRRAREQLAGLGQCRLDDSKMVRRAVRSGLLRFGAQGRVKARSAAAYELLFLCHDLKLERVQWMADDLTALPPPVAAQVRAMLAGASTPGSTTQVLEMTGGTLEFRIERMLDLRGDPEVLVVISLLEPLDVAVARQLLHWPLTVREKQVVIASIKPSSQRELADALGCTVGTLKGYLNDLYAKFGVRSREEMIERLLRGHTGTEPAPDGGPAMPLVSGADH